MRHGNTLKAIALLAIGMVVHAAEADVGKVITKDGFTQIENVAPLSWDKSGQTTFCGALASAANAMGIKTDYTSLMGDSSLAFRIRWWRAELEGQAGWCPSSGVGEMSPWDARAAANIGLKLDYRFEMDKDKPQMEQYAGEVKKSIDEGRPVLAYADKLDMAVIYGYADDGRTVLLRDYYHGDKPLSMKLADTKGLLAFIEKQDQLAKPVQDTPAARRDLATRAMRSAINNWITEPMGFESRGRLGQYRFGHTAYDEWIANLKSEKFTDEERKQLFQPSWWTFCVLADAREQAAAYLKKSAELYEGEAKQAVLAAAEAYGQSAKAAGAAFAKKDAFLGPWSGKKFEDWTPAVRAREAEILSSMRASDAKAIEHIERALEAK